MSFEQKALSSPLKAQSLRYQILRFGQNGLLNYWELYPPKIISGSFHLDVLPVFDFKEVDAGFGATSDDVVGLVEGELAGDAVVALHFIQELFNAIAGGAVFLHSLQDEAGGVI